MLLVLGAVDLGRLFAANVDVANAAKEGVFFAASNPLCDVSKPGCSDPNNVAWHVRNELSGLSGSSTSVRCFDAAGSPVALSACSSSGGRMRVTVAYPFRLFTPLVGVIVGSPLTLTGSASAVVLNGAAGGSPPPPAPQAEFAANPSSGSAPLFVQFQDSSMYNPTSWAWDFGDGVGKSTLTNPSYTYSAPGNYVVSLVATNSSGSSTPVTHSVSVNVPTPTCQAPTVTASVTPTTGTKKSTSFTFSGTSSLPAATWSWDFGDGTVVSGTGPAVPSQGHVYKKAGSYTGELTVTTGSTCSTTTVKNAPTVTVN